MSLADTYVEVKPDTRNFGPTLRRDLSRVNPGPEGERAGSKYAEGFGRGTSRLGAVAGRAVTVLSGALVAAAGAAGILGVKTAAANENAAIAFETMLGSGEKAQKFLQELRDFAKATPFEFPELQRAASSLVSIGVEAKDVIPIMTTLGDVTAGMGTGSEGIRRATVALQQMNAAQRITAEDLNQLRDAGIPVYDLLAAATGKTKQQIAAMVQGGKLGKKELDQLMEALKTGGGGLERFTGLMEKQSHSLIGLWSTLKDTFSEGMAEALEPLIPLIKDGLAGAIKFTAAAMPPLRDALRGGIEAIKGWGTHLTALGDFFRKHGPEVKGAMAGLATAFGTLKAVNAVGLLKDLAGGFKAMIIGMGPLGWIAAGIGVLVGVFTAAASKGGPLHEQVEGIKALFGEGWNDPANKSAKGIDGLFKRIGSAIRKAWPEIKRVLGETAAMLWQWIVDSVPKVLKALGGWVGDVATWIKDEGLPKLKEKFGEWGQALTDWVNKPGTDGKTGLQRAKDKLGEWASKVSVWLVTTALPWLRTSLQSWTSALVEWVSKPDKDGKTPLDKTKEALGRFVKGVTDWVDQEAAPAIGRAMNGLADKMDDWIDRSLPGVSANLGKWAAKVVGFIYFDVLPKIIFAILTLVPRMEIWAIKAIPGTLTALAKWLWSVDHWFRYEAIPTILLNAYIFVTSFWGEIKKRFSGLSLANIGARLIGSLITGLYSGWRSITQWASSIKDAIVRAVMDLFDMHSPSRVMYGLGANMVGGVLNALSDGKGRLQQLAKVVFGSPMGALQAMGSAIGAAWENIFGGAGRRAAGYGHTLSRIRAALLPGLTITSAYRDPAHNRRVGGSPTSLHMDVRNPAVDIGGPTYLLDRFYTVLRQMGGWRQLFWRVPGHYDHIHVADTGGLLDPGRLGLNLGTKPERILSAHQTEAFDRLVTVLEGMGGAGGGARTLVLVDQDGALIGRMRAEAGGVLDEELADARWGVG